MKFITNQKLKIIFGLIFAFLAVEVVSQFQFFINPTPRINPSFIAKLKDVPQIAINSVRGLFNRQSSSSEDFFSKLPQGKAPVTAVFKSVSKGVMAAEDPSTNTKYIRIINGTKFVEQKYTLSNGKTIMVIAPLSQ